MYYLLKKTKHSECNYELLDYCLPTSEKLRECKTNRAATTKIL